MSDLPAPRPDPHALARLRSEQGARLVLRGVALNILLGLAKLTGGLLGHTFALVADAIESLLDVFSSLLAWAGFRYAARPPDADHPYGHGKAEPLAALIIALVVFAASAWIAANSVREILNPGPLPHWGTLPLLAVIVAVKWIFSRRLAAEAGSSGGVTLDAESWHHAADALTSAAAFIGISLAILGGPAWASADDWAALLACLVISFNGLFILRKALAEVMDTAAPDELHAAIRAAAAAVPGVIAIDKCRVRRSGLAVLVDIQIVVDPSITVRAGHALAHDVQDKLVGANLAVTHVSVHVEPAHEENPPERTRHLHP